MQVVVWIIIILAIIFLIWLLRKWIKRLIFILILLVLAFLIYGIFNPSGAARLWYNIRTFPQRMASWMGSEKEFLDYDKYKLDISEIGDKIGLVDDEDLFEDEKDDSENDDIEEDEDRDIDEKEKINFEDDEDEYEKVKEDEEKVNIENDTKKTIKTFPKTVKFIKMPDLKGKDKTGHNPLLTGYSKSDLLGVINKYIENNLNDDTDILVTVEYDEEDSTVQKIILQAQAKDPDSNQDSDNTLGDLFIDSHGVNSEKMVVSVDEVTSENDWIKTQNTQRTTTTKLTQKEQREAEEIFSILF